MNPPPPVKVPQEFALSPHESKDVLLAEVSLATPDAATISEPAASLLRFDDTESRARAAKLLRQAIGPCVIGAQNCVRLARPLDQVKPLHLVLQADVVPPLKDLASFFPTSPVGDSNESPPTTIYWLCALLGRLGRKGQWRRGGQIAGTK